MMVPEGLSIAYKSLNHRSWQVRAAAYGFCAVVRDPATVPRLLARLDDEKGRLREDLLDALWHLTSMRFSSSKRWEQWWEKNAETFSMPPPLVMNRSSAADANASTIGFFNIPLVSHRVAFHSS